MDEIKKHQRLCAIHLAIVSGNFRCAETVFEDCLRERIQELLVQINKLALKNGHTDLMAEIDILIQEYNK